MTQVLAIQWGGGTQNYHHAGIICITKCNIRYTIYYTSTPHMPTDMLKGFKRHSRNKRDPWDRLGTAEFNTPLYIRYGGHLQKRGLRAGSPPRPGSGTTSHTQTPTPVQAHTSQHQLLHTLTLRHTRTPSMHTLRRDVFFTQQLRAYYVHVLPLKEIRSGQNPMTS